MKILLDIAERLESRAKGGADSPDSVALDEPLWMRGIWAALAAEVRAAVIHEEQQRARAAEPPPDYTYFDPKTDLLSIADLATIQRVGRDEEAGSTSIALGLYDTIINGYRWLFGEHINAQRQLAALQERLEATEDRLKAARAAMTYVQPIVHIDRTDDYCRGNCSRGGDGPPCGKRNCQG